LLQDYFPILVFIGIGLALGAIPIIAGKLLGPHKPDPEKLSPYECGFEAFSDARTPFDIKFYLVAILFIIFDLETAFLFPWAVAVRKLGWFGFAAISFFLLVLVIGFIYEWQRGALEWE
jgi:NADH-quinone oxidoreductase subunit A